jgi:hypothetical protein
VTFVNATNQLNYMTLRSFKKADQSFATLACDAATGHMTGSRLRIAPALALPAWVN